MENPKDIPRFCNETEVPVALDESVDEDDSPSYETLETIASEGVVAVVVKPGRVGGFERAASIAAWAKSRGMQVVISSAFETSIGLTAYAQLAAYVDEASPVAHGLGTYTWLGGDIIENRKFQAFRDDNSMVVPIVKTSPHYQFNESLVTSLSVDRVIESSSVKIASGKKMFTFRVWDTKSVVSELGLIIQY